MIFVGEEYLLDLDSQKARYLEHNNQVDDPGYREFLSQLWIHVKPLLSVDDRGIDYGSGSGPALVAMMRECGFVVEGYDPIFASNPELLQRSYDFVTCTETVEHFQRPGDEFHRLDTMIEPGGLLGIMTSIVYETDTFSSWYYMRDPTHVSFYSPRTMEWIADRMDWCLEMPAENIAIFQKLDS